VAKQRHSESNTTRGRRSHGVGLHGRSCRLSDWHGPRCVGCAVGGWPSARGRDAPSARGRRSSEVPIRQRRGPRTRSWRVGSGTRCAYAPAAEDGPSWVSGGVQRLPTRQRPKMAPAAWAAEAPAVCTEGCARRVPVQLGIPRSMGARPRPLMRMATLAQVSYPQTMGLVRSGALPKRNATR
jgi:hypothetical protein